MSHSLTKKLNVGILLTFTIATMLVFSSSASAQESTEEASSDTTFSFVAEEGDNLTKLVRRSVELYSKSQDVELSDGKAIAAETCAVQALGSYQLNVGQSIEISSAEIATAFDKAMSLDEITEARWASYGPITRTLNDIQPVSAPEFVDVTDIKQPEVSDETVNETPTEVVATTDSTAEEDSGDDAPWYWWAIGGGAIGAMWYVLGGNEAVKNRRKK